MRWTEEFIFDDEPGDPAEITARLEEFRAMGLELGAHVQVWYCDTCDVADAFFRYPNREEPD
jgi:hypothetical protein